MPPESYVRSCPVHFATLAAIWPPENFKAERPAPERYVPELWCTSGKHYVGYSCQVSYWEVCHSRSGHVVFKANEKYRWFMGTRVLMVAPADLEKKTPDLGGLEGGD